eukprot:gene1159-416_t
MSVACKVEWPPLESNPDAFTKLARSLGLEPVSGNSPIPATSIGYIHPHKGLGSSVIVGMVPSWGFTDIFGLDPDLLAMVPEPVAAVVLLFPTQSEKIESFRRECLPADPDTSAYYLHQYVGNACGTFALCHALFNRPDLLSGESPLIKFAEETQSLSPHERGTRFAETPPESHPVFSAHVAVANDDSVNQTAAIEAAAKVSEHFTVYVETPGSQGKSVIELDGRLKKVVRHDVASVQGRFVDKVASIVKAQFFDIDPEQTNFNLMALCKLG